MEKEDGRMDKKKGTIALVATTCLGVATWMAAAAHRGQQQRLRALESEMKTMAERVRDDAATARRAERAQWARSAPVATPAAEPAAKEDPAPTAPEVTRDPAVNPAAEIRSTEEYYEKVAMAFSSETTDGAWARENEYDLRKALSELAETSSVQSLECRQTLCKADVQHVDQEKFSAFIDRTIAKATAMWKGEISWYRDSTTDDGAVHSTLYFGKPGVSINQLALAQ
jgi:hypothetical protein